MVLPFESIKLPPGAWQASSIIQRPYSSASFLNSSVLTGYPAKSTGIIPLKNPFGLLSINFFHHVYISNYYIILNCNDYMYNKLIYTILPPNVLINNVVINKERFTGTLTQGIYSNIQYAIEHFIFKYFIVFLCAYICFDQRYDSVTYLFFVLF